MPIQKTITGSFTDEYGLTIEYTITQKGIIVADTWAGNEYDLNPDSAGHFVAYENQSSIFESQYKNGISGMINYAEKEKYPQETTLMNNWGNYVLGTPVLSPEAIPETCTVYGATNRTLIGLILVSNSALTSYTGSIGCIASKNGSTIEFTYSNRGIERGAGCICIPVYES